MSNFSPWRQRLPMPSTRPPPVRRSRADDVRTCYQRDMDRIVLQQGIPPPDAQDPGVSAAGGRPLPHPDDPHPGGQPHRPAPSPGALRLNEDLTEAIALGHDLGHTPFGHAGEVALTRGAWGRPFRHNEQSLRVVDRAGKGRPGAEPDLRGPHGHPGPHRGQRPAADAGGADRPARRPASPISTTTLTTPCAPGSSANDDIPASISPIFWATPTGSGSTRWCGI